MTTVTLTFDNGPSVDTTPFVLEQLRSRDLPAYFCLIGRQLAKGQSQVDIVKETLSQGHILVNHSYTHGTALGDDPTPSHANHEIVDTHKMLGEKLGDWGSRWFRPFGRGGEIGQHLMSESAVLALTALDYSVLLWNSVPRDWEDPRGWVKTALKDIDNQEHTVLVLHDLKTGAMDHLGQFLDVLLERGDVITNKLPDSCVPLRRGKKVWDNGAFAKLVAAQQN